uniref:Uncharacterized protein n=1 Tax=Arundo donax TaxID=35708 RepID=A0A0A8Y0X1_ARUDO
MKKRWRRAYYIQPRRWRSCPIRRGSKAAWLLHPARKQGGVVAVSSEGARRRGCCIWRGRPRGCGAATAARAAAAPSKGAAARAGIDDSGCPHVRFLLRTSPQAAAAPCRSPSNPQVCF